MSEVKIVGWSAKISVEFSDKSNKFVHYTTDDLPEWQEQWFNLFINDIKANTKLLIEEEV